MTVHQTVFDSHALYEVLDAVRRQRRISWRQLSREAGLPVVSMGTRLKQGHSLNADNLILLLIWLGDTDIKPYIRAGTPAPDSETLGAGK